MKTYLKKKMHQILMRTLCKVSCVELQLELLLELLLFHHFQECKQIWRRMDTLYDHFKEYLDSLLLQQFKATTQSYKDFI